MPPTIEQMNAIENIYSFLERQEKGFYLLKGSAGTGKTYTVKYIIKKIDDEMGDVEYSSSEEEEEEDKTSSPSSKLQINFCAPTHKALKVLRKSFEGEKYRDIIFKFQTVSRMLMKSKSNEVVDGKIISNFLSKGYDYATKTLREFKLYDEDTKTTTTYKYFDSEIIREGIYIIDECSMIDKKDFEILEKLKNYYDLRILFLGDWAQLAPINKKGKKCKLSKTLTHVKDYSSLNSTQRINNNNLTDIYAIFRNCVYDTSLNYKNFIYPYMKNEVEGVRVMTSQDEFINEIKTNFKNHGNSCILSYTKNKVKYYNDMMKKIISPERKEEWVIGDRIVFNSTYKSTNHFCSGEKDKYGKWSHWPCRYINNNDYGYITNVEIEEEPSGGFFKLKNPLMKYKLSITLIDCSCTLKDEINTSIYKVFDKDKKRFQKYKNLKKNEILEDLKSSKKMMPPPNYEKHKKTVLEELEKEQYKIESPCLSAYSTTIRKSQGSTYEDVFLDTRDIDHIKEMSDSDKARSLYTAVSRASKNIYILVKLDNSDKHPKFIEEKLLKTCSRCHSRKEVKRFERKNGIIKKTCNSCSFSAKRSRLKNLN